MTCTTCTAWHEYLNKTVRHTFPQSKRELCSSSCGFFRTKGHTHLEPAQLLWLRKQCPCTMQCAG